MKANNTNKKKIGSYREEFIKAIPDAELLHSTFGANHIVCWMFLKVCGRLIMTFVCNVGHASAVPTLYSKESVKRKEASSYLTEYND
ncbi:hypothetical protein PGTUg99_017514 [Puccinia graminis f. sp. tritici]|uniref:Uncharacterized protein n=1 Tax=Puccinia graminis f. sp. tritici TaxID=56615 RepID=A0A5B0NS90_PUCGR|nr:hypothetical protein PGTUg99_017514 [Puccinia graminis f. sp. tritici]